MKGYDPNYPHKEIQSGTLWVLAVRPPERPNIAIIGVLNK